MINPIEITAYELAQRFVNQKEIVGEVSNPQILAMLRLDAEWPKDDAVPWCSGFVNYVCWLLRLPRSKSLRARSWLNVGYAVDYEIAEVGFDVVILKRGGGDQPGPEVINAPGHVGFFGGWDSSGVQGFYTGEFKPSAVKILGGNQSDEVNVTSYNAKRILGIHRLRS